VPCLGQGAYGLREGSAVAVSDGEPIREGVELGGARPEFASRATDGPPRNIGRAGIAASDPSTERKPRCRKDFERGIVEIDWD
jgi:hypothetical protein